MARAKMTIQEAIHTMRERSNITQRDVSDQTGIPESTLSRKLNMFDDGAHLTVLELTPVMKAFRDATPLNSLCRANGGIFVRLPRGRASLECSLKEFQSDFSHLFGLLLDFTNDPTPDKLTGIDKACVDHMNKTAHMRAGMRSRAMNQYEFEFTEDET